MSITAKGAIEWLERRAEEAPGKGSRECYLLAIAAIREKAEREDPKPLTLEELRQMDGEPVWVKPRNADRGEGEWCVICLYYNKLDFDASIPGVESYWYPSNEYGKTWSAYRHKPKEV